MVEKRLKANKAIAGTPCGWCSKALALAEDTAVCPRCETVHHAACWDEQRGCSDGTCENAPLRELPSEPAQVDEKPLPPGRKRCPHCGRVNPTSARVCRYCKRADTPDGTYTGPRPSAPGATASLVYGILGLFICGIIFGILAIAKAGEARKAIGRDPSLGGEGLATAGRVLGIIALVLWGIIVLARVGGAL